jgi:hypothetical protein
VPVNQERRPRRNHTPAFKAKVAVAAIKGLHVHDRLGSSGNAATENIGRSVFELRFPRHDLVWVHVNAETLLKELRPSLTLLSWRLVAC